MQSQLAVVAVVILAFSGCATVVPRVFQNVHEVVPGTLYRSAQPSGPRLQALVEKHGIRSVLNLRGASPGEGWYDEELAAASAAGLAHYDYAMSSKREVSRAEADELIRLMREAPKPLLVHCWAGADRTGLASALYLYALEGQTADDAVRALSWRYHHFSFTSAGAMDRSFAAFVGLARASPASP